MVVSNFITIDEAYSFQLPQKVKLKETAILYKTKKIQNKKDEGLKIFECHTKSLYVSITVQRFSDLIETI